MDGHAKDGSRPGLPGGAVGVVIVTYNSGSVLPLCLDALGRQTRLPDQVIIVDNHSADAAYLDAIREDSRIRLVRSPSNEGFCGGNNRGYRLARDCKYILFLNPDAFATERLIEEAVAWMERPQSSRLGCLTGTLLEFDIARRQPTGRIDSTGIFQTSFGKWYDRGQGTPWVGSGAPPPPEPIPAVCGAFMFCRASALAATAIRNDEVFDSRFFMYKEDIDLSLRLRAGGWELQYLPALLCYHGRGWQGRKQVSYRAKYLSARNELRVSMRNRLKGLPYSLLKFLYVLSLERLLMRLVSRP
jgi:N-acetylglucosaminyl-diphospho-decaprenol L-rhamnosyltransferase